MLRTILLTSYVSAFFFVLLSISGMMNALNLFQTDHALFAILYMLFFIVTEAAVLFYFIGTGKYIKDTTKSRKLDTSNIQKTREFKKKVFPVLTINLFLFIIVFTMGGAVSAYKMNPVYHSILGTGLCIYYIRSVLNRHQVILENARLLISVNSIR